MYMYIKYTCSIHVHVVYMSLLVIGDDSDTNDASSKLSILMNEEELWIECLFLGLSYVQTTTTTIIIIIITIIIF